MTVRTRFAPSPTGLLHIGGARTALYNYLFAKAQGGEFILRIEDTDLERSKREYEEGMIQDLRWVGLTYDEGPDKPGKFGPYRQSERLDLYKQLAWELVDKGFAYPCFLTPEELEKNKEKAIAEKKAPHFYDSQYRNYDLDAAKKRIESGELHVIRFKNPDKEFSFKDIVRGEVCFPADMVGDFVIIRGNGLPVYNFCCMVDDWKMEISHVIRAEEHLPNTLRQLMLYEAFEVKLPVFAHVSLLVGEDRQKLSKRHGATSVKQYRDLHYLPEALMNYLCLLGWSHPDEKDIFELKEIEQVFDLSRFTKASAFYDIQKLNYFNGQYLRKLNLDHLLDKVDASLPKEHPFRAQTPEWKGRCLDLFKEKINLVSELEEHLKLVFELKVEESADQVKEREEAQSWETTPQIRDYLKEQLQLLKQQGEAHVDGSILDQWMNYIKKEMKIKGRPLFMGVRVVLTLQTHGPDLKQLIPLTPIEILISRVG